MPGLPETVTQTTDGYLWIGTYAGLVRFDGVRFVPWTSPDGKQLPDYRIYSVLGAKDGSLWIGTANGLSRWKNGELTNFSEPAGRINGIVEDRDGNVWIARSMIPGGGPGGGALCRVTDERPHCYGAAEGIPLTVGMRLVIDSSGALWIGGPTGLWSWKSGSVSAFFQRKLNQQGMLVGVIALGAQVNGDIWSSVEQPGGGLQLQHFSGGVWHTYPLSGASAKDQAVTAIFEDCDGVLWIGTARHGIYRIFHDEVDHFASADGLSSDAVANFFQDREGTLWVATSKGLDSLRDLPIATYSIREGLTADSVSTVLASHDGSLWIGNSGAIDVLKNNKLTAIRTDQGLPGRDVTTMFEDHLSRLWAGVDSGLYVSVQGAFRSVVRPDGSRLGVIYAITEDTEGNVWIRAKHSLFRIRDLRVEQEVDLSQVAESFALAADTKDGIWLGFVNGDLARYRQGQLEMIPADRSLSTAKIRKLIPDPDGSVWSVTEKGLVWWRAGHRAILTTRNGLPCNELYTLVIDDENNFWLFSRCGIIAITNDEMQAWLKQASKIVKVKTFDVFDGAQPGLTPLQPQSTRSADGRIWFANDSVLQMLEPKRLHENVLPPSVLLDGIVADGKTYQAQDRTNLPALIKNLEIDYTAPSFVAPQKVLFRYKLEGHDRDWQDPQTRRQAFYSDLSPGKYKFRVIACNNDGVWNESGAAVGFTVLPAFYQTSSFIVVCVAALLGVAWFLYLLRMRQVVARVRERMQERLGERERIARDLHDTLLQSVQGLILRFHAVAKQISEHEQARKAMEQALDRADEVMVEGRDRVRNLRGISDSAGDLAEALRSLGEQLASEGATAFRVVVEGKPGKLHPIIREEAFSIGREALVNAFRHAQSQQIEVEISYEPRQLRLRIRDDGCGIDADILEAGGRQDHWGLQGMRERARKISAQLEIWSRAGTGTEIELRVPASTAHAASATRPIWRFFSRVVGRGW